MQVIPSIVAEEFYEIETKLSRLESLPDGLIDWVHLDVVDGKFASPKTWPFTAEYVDEAVRDLEDLRTKFKVGLHLMVKRPDEHLDKWIEAPLSRISIHDEALGNIESTLAVIDMTKTESCVVLKMDTPLEELEGLIDHVDAVQLMSIDKIGGYGASFNSEVFDKIEEFKESYPDKPLIIDGGVNESNIAHLSELGTSAVIVGSAIWKSNDIEGAVKKLKDLAK